MIRINLLPVQQGRQRQYGVQQLALGLILVAAEVALLFVLFNNKAEEKRTLLQSNAAVTAEVQQLEAENERIAELNERKEQLMSMALVLEELEANRGGPVYVLDELKTMLNAPAHDLEQANQRFLGWDPTWDPTTVWLTAFDESAGAVGIRGRAMSNDDIAEFNIRLASSAYFSQVRLNVTRAVNDQTLGRVFEFEISAQVNYAVIPERS